MCIYIYIYMVYIYMNLLLNVRTVSDENLFVVEP